MPLCSIIIPVYNRANLTRQCVNKILNNPPVQGAFEIIIVDDGSRDGTAELLAGYGDRVRVLTHAVNTCFAVACNDGARVARGKYLVFLNNDTIPLHGWLDALVHHAGVHPRAGVVGSKLLYPNGTIQHAGIVFGQDGHPHHVYLGFPADHPAVNRPRRFRAVTGACILVARDTFCRSGGFDTGYVNCYEDVDLCLRLGEMGLGVHYCPESVLYHLESVSEGRSRGEELSQKRFQERWASRIYPDDWQYYVEDDLVQIRYHANHLELAVAPCLGVVREESDFSRAGRLLALRARQVHSLLRENVLLRAAAEAPAEPAPAGPVG